MGVPQDGHVRDPAFRRVTEYRQPEVVGAAGGVLDPEPRPALRTRPLELDPYPALVPGPHAGLDRRFVLRRGHVVGDRAHRPLLATELVGVALRGAGGTQEQKSSQYGKESAQATSCHGNPHRRQRNPARLRPQWLEPPEHALPRAADDSLHLVIRRKAGVLGRELGSEHEHVRGREYEQQQRHQSSSDPYRAPKSANSSK